MNVIPNYWAGSWNFQNHLAWSTRRTITSTMYTWQLHANYSSRCQSPWKYLLRILDRLLALYGQEACNLMQSFALCGTEAEDLYVAGRVIAVAEGQKEASHRRRKVFRCLRCKHPPLVQKLKTRDSKILTLKPIPAGVRTRQRNRCHNGREIAEEPWRKDQLKRSNRAIYLMTLQPNPTRPRTRQEPEALPWWQRNRRRGRRIILRDTGHGQ